MSALTTKIQNCTQTLANRYDHLLKIIEAKCMLDEERRQRFKILCYGCSDGHEITSLLETFPYVQNVTGVDINLKALRNARELHKDNKKVTILSSDEFAALPEFKCDFITCFNVLCNFKSKFSHSTPIAFSVFEQSVQTLATHLNPQGILCVYGANYCVTDVPLPAHIIPTPLIIDSGFVPMYRPDGESVMIRGSQHIFLLRNIQEDEITDKDVKIIIQTEIEQHQKYGVEETFNFTAQIPCAKRTVTFGLMGPGKQSSNLGDYMQTLAQVNILSHFYNPKTWRCSAIVHTIMQHFASSKPQGYGVRQQQYSCDEVKIVWVNRDDSATELSQNNNDDTIYVIANGWYMHRDPESKEFKFPFASHIHPIFVSMHIAHPDILQDLKVCDYLRKHQPIGCRDHDTRDLMISKGIAAYFSSCLTTTLDGIYVNNPSATNEHLRIDTVDSNISHNLSHSSPDILLFEALGQLKQYAGATSIHSTRIHCLLPTRAVSDAPKLFFCSRTGGQDATWLNRSRFSGLTEVMEDGQSREILATVLQEDVIERVHNIFFQIPTSACLNESLNLSQQSMLEIRPNLIRAMHPSSILCASPSTLSAIFKETNVRKTIERRCPMFDENFQHKREFVLRKCPLRPFTNQIDIFVTFDNVYVTIFQTFLQHLAAANQTSLLRIWCATRKVMQWPVISKTPPNVILHHIPLDQSIQFSNYMSPLKHVSEVCLDRILIEKIDFGIHQVNRILYIDLDIAIVGSLTPLLNIDTGLKGIAAKTSIIQNVMNSWLKKYELLSPEQKVFAPEYTHARSFNAGVLVLDIDKLKKNSMYDNCKELYTKFGLNDQMLLNFYCQGQHKELPKAFNIFVGQDDHLFTPLQGLPNSAICYHFVGSHKPWLAKHAKVYDNPTLHDLWFKFERAKLDKVKHVAG